MEEKTKKEIELALIKRAVGYDAKEIVEEFSSDEEGGERLCKRKITTKNFPPDVTAAKLLLCMNDEKDLSSLSDEELEEEKNKIYKILEDLKDESDKQG